MPGACMTKPSRAWRPDSWREFPAACDVQYPDPSRLSRAVRKLRELPPLVTSFEIERLRALLAQAQVGERFLLQGGDCAETLADCRPGVIAGTLKVLLRMGLVLGHGLGSPVIRVGRLAGQYAKPRSSPMETRTVGGREVTLPSYFGDLVNRAGFSARARRPDPALMVAAHQHAAMTLNFVRGLMAGGFGDHRRPGRWDAAAGAGAGAGGALREYARVRDEYVRRLSRLEGVAADDLRDIECPDIFTSHEGLNLHYESALTRRVPHREGWYDLGTHLPWIGVRTAQPVGAHVEFFRGVRNPVGVKVGPDATPAGVLGLLDRLNPGDEPGRMVLITRVGAGRAGALVPILGAVRESGRRVLWVCDPMHGNTRLGAGGLKTRLMRDILGEVEETLDAHAAAGTRLGGLHVELTGEDVRECDRDVPAAPPGSGGYGSACDPRLGAAQALEVALRLAGWMSRRGAEASVRGARGDFSPAGGVSSAL
jgi:3-deoxy-7-phosphoheptulonate synthase